MSNVYVPIHIGKFMNSGYPFSKGSLLKLNQELLIVSVYQLVENLMRIPVIL